VLLALRVSSATRRKYTVSIRSLCDEGEEERTDVPGAWVISRGGLAVSESFSTPSRGPRAPGSLRPGFVGDSGTTTGPVLDRRLPAGAQATAREVHHDAEEPGAEAVTGVKLGEVEERVEKRVLHDVLRLGTKTEDAEGKPLRRAPVPVDQDREGFPIAGEHALDDGGVVLIHGSHPYSRRSRADGCRGRNIAGVAEGGSTQ
jgi:hypothetical protein